jgi:hypothetical protein
MITFDRNPRSRSTGLSDHLPPESVITFDRNAHAGAAQGALGQIVVEAEAGRPRRSGTGRRKAEEKDLRAGDVGVAGSAR